MIAMNTNEICKNVTTPSCIQQPLSVATPDGGLLYTGFKSINYIAMPPLSENDAPASEVKTMSTRFTINALDVSPLWDKPENKTLSGPNHGKHFAIVAEDFSVQVWDCTLGEAIIGHKAHQHQHEVRDLRMFPFNNVLMSYISNGNILSIDTNDLVVYCVASNSYCRRPMFIPPRNYQLSVLRCSPYNENLFALGSTSGTVLICDLRQMSILFKLKSHGQNFRICGLAWRKMSPCNENSPMPDKNEQWRSSAPVASPIGKAPLLKSKAAESDDCFDIYNFDHLESEFGVPVHGRPRLASKSSDDCGDFVGFEKLGNNVTIDYVEACESLKADLLALTTDNSENPQLEVNLQDCEKTKSLGAKSDCSNISQKDENSGTLVSNSTEGSLEVLQYNSSSDDGVIVDGEAAKPKREVLHHIYHQAEVHDAPELSKATQQDRLKDQPQPSAKLLNESCSDTMSHSSYGASVRSDILLASINENDIIMIWNTQNGAHCGKSYSKGQSTAKFNQVHWLSDNIILSLSRQQCLFWSMAFDAKMLRFKLNKHQLFKCSVQDVLTCAPITIDHQIWICMKNRNVGILNPQNGEFNAVFGCLSFGVRAMAECPEDMNKIALGCSDKRLAIFDISKLSTRCVPIESISLNSNVYSLTWSPDCLHLAFGTFDGTIGIVGVERMKIKTIFYTAYKKEIYSLMWQDNFIYFIVNRQMGVFDVRHNKKEAIMLSHIERPSYLYVRDAFLFVGSEDGFLKLYERQANTELTYTCVRQISLLSRYFTDILFNPLERNQFAVVGHDRLVYIMEFQPQERDWNKLHKFTASDQKASIASVKWSNMSAHLLLTFHIEGKVCMWNTKEPEQPPLTISYHCPMWCGLFMPTNENIIMCSGKSVSLDLINIQEALTSNKKHICSKMDALLNVKWGSKSLSQPFGRVLTATEKKRQRREKRVAAQAELPPAGNEQTANNSNDLQQGAEEQIPIENMLGALTLDTQNIKTHATLESSKSKEPTAQPNKFLAHSRTCLFLTQKELNKSALEKLAIVLTEDAAKIDKSVLMSKLFSTKVMAKDLIATELTNLRHSNNKDIAPLCLATSTFKVHDELQQHIANKTLNEWHVSVAPAVSYVFWQKCCKAYGQQLAEQGYILHAATYFTAVDMQTEAINLLLEHEYYREALANARIHLPATDPMIKTIINKWLEQLEKTGNYAAAALICVLDNQMLRGYSFLRKFRNCTPEIADLMEQIKRIGQLGSLFDNGCPHDRNENEQQDSDKDTEEAG